MPMVWSACEREDFVPDVQAMRRRVESLVPAGCATARSNSAPVALRDVEFAVQLLQLVHGRTDESLHVTSTVDALAALSAGGYVGRDDAANLTASYEFLRLLEHRLQLQRLKRTPRLARSGRRRGAALAGPRRPRSPGRNPRRTGGVARGDQAAEHAGVAAARQAVLCPAARIRGPLSGFEPGMSTESAERQLAALGYEGPQKRADASGRTGQSEWTAWAGAGGAAAPAAGLAVGHSGSRQRSAGLPADQ